MTTQGLPLTGLRVLDLTLARSGPTCVRHLADWGADVIRILPPDGGREVIGRRGSDYQNLHRNKRALTLDLKSSQGYAAFLDLVREADVFVENMRVGVKHRLKIAWEDLHPINSRLVYGSISGFGQTGPYSERGGVDQIAQGMGGLMSVTGEPGRGPMRVGIAVADMSAGNLLALGIMMALFERERTGLGKYVHTSLLESQVFMLDFQASRFLMDGDVPDQVGNGHPTIVPMGAFPASDGHVNIAPSSPKQWEKLCEVLGKPEWLTRSGWTSYSDRLRARTEIDAAISLETREKPAAYWVERLEQAGIPCGPIYRMDQVFEDPQVKHLELAAPLVHPERGPTRLVASPLNFEGCAKVIRSPASDMGSVPGEVRFESKSYR
ncbi:MAG TPA: CoA transferase [Polyangiales bacterium]|nr:CoA transferase [Polyangiales bacterium]